MTAFRTPAVSARYFLFNGEFFARVFCFLLAFGVSANAKVFDRCELAQVLHNKHRLDLHEVATWTCIAQHSSDFNTEAYAGGLGGGSHGLFQISDVYWCSPPGKGFACNLPCERLRDADLTDDLNCLHIIYDEHQRLSGNGYNAWNAYQQFCRVGVEAYVQDCFSNQRILPATQRPVAYTPFASAPAQFYTPTSLAIHSNAISSSYSTHKRGKVYDRCELAQELYYKHKMPMDQIPTWVCIAQHESHFDTSAVGRLNADGSADHGIFQISDLYWCSHDRYSGGKACGLQCTKLLDNDITDDVRCVKRIHNEHSRLSGDGFTAWTVYNEHCRNQQYAFVSACFKDQQSKLQQPAKTHVFTAPVTFISQTPQAHVYQANPFLKHVDVPQKSTPTLQQHQHQYTSPNTYTQPHNTQQHKGKVYKRCELAQELYFKHKFPMQDIATWVCIVQHESNYDTSAVGRLTGDGSADHGLFQISDLYWCSHDNFGGKACNIPCAMLLDSDITDDIKCVRTIHEEHTRISGDGFTAWPVYNRNCRNQQIEQVSGCFDSNELSNTEQFLTTMQVGDHNSDNSTRTTTTGLAEAKGKIYKECELAQELYYKHRLPLKDIPTWVCIAKHESSFKTAAVGRLNADGSADHGLFQISDLYWCSHEDYGGKACNIPCHKLLDSDISDDVQCIKTIHAEHTRISGDGFTAWVVYNRHCQNQQLERVAKCFAADEIQKAQHAGAVIETNTVVSGEQTSEIVGKGKIYKKCELAQELYFKHKMPMEEIPTWVCIAEHESSFNTAAVGRLNGDGSADHGLFQISDLYWCSHDGGGGKACQISCSKLLDNDITDDVRCVKTIYEEHTHLSGDGFTAWTVYNRNCRNQQLEKISSCFDSNELQKAQQAIRVGQSELPIHVVQPHNTNQLMSEPKKIKHKSELNHPFVNNPFLNQYKAIKSVPTTKLSSATTVRTTTNDVPVGGSVIVPSKTAYMNNLFLSQFIQPHKPSPGEASKSKTHTNIPNSISIPASYASNPFLLNNHKSVYGSQKPQKLNFNSNPFLTKYINQTASLTNIKIAIQKTSTALATGGQQKAPFQNNPFLQNVSAATQSLSTTPATKPDWQQSGTISNSTDKMKLHIYPAKPYVNSDVFRTTPVKSQFAHVPLGPSIESQAPNTATELNTQNNLGASRPQMPTAASHTSNSFLNQYEQANTSSPKVQKLNFNYNPFLTKYIDQSVSLTNTEAISKQTSTATPERSQQKAPFQDNPFLQNLSTKPSTKPEYQQPRTTPSSTEKIKLHLYPAKPYVNSDVFRTTPVKSQVPIRPLELGHESNTSGTTTKPSTQHYIEASKPKQQANETASTTTHIRNASNPLLSKYELANTSPNEDQKLNFVSNPFLTYNTDQSTGFTQINNKSTVSPPAKQQLQSALYQNNSFLEQFSATTQSLISKTSTKPIREQSRPTPSSTERTKLHLYPTKPYVNSDVFRTSPVKSQVPSTQLQPASIALTPTTTAKTITQNSQLHYFSSLPTTTTKKPTIQGTVIGKPVVGVQIKNQPTMFAGITTTKRPSVATTWHSQLQSQVQPTKVTSMQKATTKPTTTRTTRPTKLPRTTTTIGPKTTKLPLTTSSTSKKAAVTTTRRPLVIKNTAIPPQRKTTQVTTNRPRTTISNKTPQTTKNVAVSQRPKSPWTTTTAANKSSTTTPIPKPQTVKVSAEIQRPKTTKVPGNTNQSATTTRTLLTRTTQQHVTTKTPTTNQSVTKTTSRNVSTSTTKTAILTAKRASTTTTRRPLTTVRQKTSVMAKTTTRPTTTITKTTQRTTTPAKMQLSYFPLTTTRKPATTVRTPSTHKTTKPLSTTKVTTKRPISGSANSFTTARVPYSTRKSTTTLPYTQFKIKSHNNAVTTRAPTRTTATKTTTKLTTTVRTTTRRPSALYVTSGTKAATTTLRPKVSGSSTIRTTNPYRDDPFSHPFFAKYKEQFEVFASTTTRKPAVSLTKYAYQPLGKSGEESEYYQQFRNHTAGNVKTVYAYAFGQNSTLPGR